METFSAELALCEGNRLVTGRFPSHRLVTLFSLICTGRNISANTRDVGDLRGHDTDNGVNVLYQPRNICNYQLPWYYQLAFHHYWIMFISPNFSKEKIRLYIFCLYQIENKSEHMSSIWILNKKETIAGKTQYIPWNMHRESLAFAFCWLHYDDVIMTTIASQITSLTSVYSTVYSDADQRKHQSSASLAFVWGIRRDRWIPRTKGQ